jgi:hypothetical protein
MGIVFSSTSPGSSRPFLEKLLFFNPKQNKVRDGIEDSLAHFGVPRLEEKATGLSIFVGEYQTQALFAFDTELSPEKPVGVVVFIRTCRADLVIMHIAVDPRYSLKNASDNFGLGLALIEKVKEIGKSLAGVQRILLFYRREVVIQL